MLDLINRYCHGYVALPVIDSLRQRSFFEAFAPGRAPGLQDLVRDYQANAGYLQAALRLLESLEILVWQDGYHRGPRFHWTQQIPGDIPQLLKTDFSPGGVTADPAATDGWLTRALSDWAVDDRMLADFLDGLILLPLLLQRDDCGSDQETADAAALLALSQPLQRFFVARGWAQTGSGAPSLTEAGQHLMARIYIAATVFSYRPMLLAMDALLFGDADAVFKRGADGHEQHVDRLMNVQGSGFQHERFFNDCQEIISDIFNQLPLANQPDYIADMGCGDGSFLRRIFQFIRTRTKRGEQLEQYPLLLIGADYNDKALTATAATLAGLPHLTLKADIGDPAGFLSDLSAAGISDADKILHVRSFLDHDRPYRAPTDLDTLGQRPARPRHGVFIGCGGQPLEPTAAYQSLVEHLARWSAILGRGGALFLEVHSMAPAAVARHVDQSENLHFDAYHAFSGQLLADADEFLLAAAESGLFPKPGFSRKYPKTLPFCRITVNWFEKRSYRIRPAFASDLAALTALDRVCWAENLSAGEIVIKARLAAYAQGQFVVEQEGEVVGALYTQRLADAAVLDDCDFGRVSSLHDPGGSIVQILGMNVAPQFQHLGLGDQLLDFMLDVYRLDVSTKCLVGVSRCKQFVEQNLLTMEDYIQRCRETEEWDTVLNFHVQHGAEIVKPIKDYWPDDVDNHGYGILIRYTLNASDAPEPESALADTASQSAREQRIDAAIMAVLGERRRHLFAADKALMEMGLDSLDLLELRSLLGRSLGVKLEPMFFFSYGTAKAIKAFFSENRTPAQAFVPPPLERSRVTLQENVQCHAGGDIAVIGMSCRFPGGTHSVEDFWQLLCSEREIITTVPAQRWDYHAYESDGINPFGGFIEDVEQFDAEFFKLSPREARLIDPQHRLLLETAWEAFEHAGVDPDASRQTGVFLGIYAHDYELLAAQRNPDKAFDVYHAIGNAAAMAAGRLSYFFGFEGPALSIDTACSSSLVAVLQACDSLRKGESRIAVAGGVNLMLAPDLTIAFSKSGMLAADGRCKTFSADADGYVRSEGCGLVVLKPLEQALKDRDTVWAVIKGGAINQDGASNGITAPNGLAQQALMRQALDNAGVDAQRISLLEAHGTGTPLGDPVEVEAVAAVYGRERPDDRPLWLSSVKTNIGHTESAAGIAGLMKLVLALKHRRLPPHRHFTQPNPRLALATIPARIPTAGETWTADAEQPCYGAVSAFGFSGTNAHMIVAETPEQPPREHIDVPCVVPVSAPTDLGLQELIRRYRGQLNEDRLTPLLDMAATAATGRKHFERRLAFVANDRDDWRQQIERLLSSSASEQIDSAQAEAVVFLFTGQGAQYLQMAGTLYRTREFFRDTFDRCSELFARHIGVSLSQILYSGEYEEADLQQTAVTQPALFCLEYALAKQWQQWGLQPDTLIGHSIGEYAAACLAGVFSLEDAVKAVAARGRLMQAQPAGGKMAAVNCTQAELERRVPPCSDRVIACFNSEDRLVLSGAAEAIDDAATKLRAAGVTVTELSVSHAFHSPLMAGMLTEFRRELESIAFNPPVLRIVSTLTGEDIGARMAEAEYWIRQIIQPVNFTTAIKTLAASAAAPGIVLEIGPRPVLTGLAKRIAGPDTGLSFLPALDPYVDDNRRVAENIAECYCAGLSLDWLAFYTDWPYRKTVLPTYPFQRQRYWLDDVYDATPQRRSQERVHPLLGEAVATPKAVHYQSSIDRRQPAWLAGHNIDGRLIFPLAGFLEMALSMLGPDRELEDVSVTAALVVSENAQVLQSSLEGDSLEIHSRDGETWCRHFTARGQALTPPAVAGELLAREEIENRLPAVSVRQFYDDRFAAGYRFGGHFVSMQTLHAGEAETLAEVRCSLPTLPYRIHPVLLDGALQAALPLLGSERAWVPFTLRRFVLYRQAQDRVFSHATLVRRDGQGVCVDISIYDADLRPLAMIQDLLFKPWQAAATGIDDWLYQVAWQSRQVPPGLDLFAARLASHLNENESFQPITGSAGRLDRLADTYVAEALRQLGCKPQQEFAGGADLCRVLALDSRFERLMQRLLERLTTEGRVRRTTSGWRIEDLAAARTQELKAGLLAEYPALDAEIDLLQRCGARLKDVWRGQADPLKLIFPPDRADATQHFYRHTPTFTAVNELLAAAVDESTDACGQPSRILEIGAGTGSATSRILPRLAGKAFSYTVTDISAYFTRLAEQEFSGYGHVDFRCLDIERNPEEQGFAAHSFDVVVAANVLHATADLERTLAHCRRLLTSGGRLILLEGIAPTAWIDVTFGLTDGWWRFDDTVRTDYPLLSCAQWTDVLRRQKLDARYIALEHADAPFRQAVIVAECLREADSGHWLVLADDGGYADRLIDAAQRQGTRVTRVTAGEKFALLEPGNIQIDAGAADDYRRLLAAVDAAGAVTQVVNLWPVQSVQIAPQTADDLMRGAEQACCPALYLLQALAAVERPGLAVCQVTLQAQQVDPGDAGVHPQGATLWGMNKVVALEHPQLRHSVVDVDDDTSSMETLAQLLLSGIDEAQLAVRRGACYVPRLREAEKTTAFSGNRCWKLADGQTTLDALRLIEQPLTELRPGQIEIRVQRAALNFIDVMDVLGLLPFPREGLGMECTGVVSRSGPGVELRPGQQVLAMAEGAFADYVVVDARLAVPLPLPETINARQAVTLPVAFVTAAYALLQVARVRPGQRVLIHAASGATGMAAVQIALQAGAQVYATASRSKWPQVQALGVTAVLNSRDLSFADELMQLTDGGGVDVVFNSLAGDFIKAGLGVLAPGGHFIEIGKREILTEKEAAELAPQVIYRPVDIRSLAQSRPEVIQHLLRALLDAVEQGVWRPLPVTEFAWPQLPEAFRYMQQARHVGKIVLHNKTNAAPFCARPVGSYLITGGFKGIGLFTAQWLAEQGARHLLLVGRSAPTAENREKIDALQASGVEVTCVVADVNDSDAMQQVFDTIRRSGLPLLGIVHSVGVLDDGSLLQQDWARYRTVLAPKMSGAWLLHRLSRDYSLDFFLMYSSVASLLGSAGQSNHAAANAYLDAFACYLRAQGVPAQSINWCGWSEIGSAAALQVSDKIRSGMSDITPQQGGEVLAWALSREEVQVGVAPIDWPTFLRHAPLAEFYQVFHPDVPIADRTQPQEPAVSAAATITDTVDLVQAGPEERNRLIRQVLSTELAAVLGMPVDRLQVLAQRRTGFFDLGLDSLTVVEFKSRVNQRLPGIDLTTAAVFDYPTLDALAEHLSGSSPQPGPATKTPTDTEAATELDDVDELSPEEAAALLAKELESP